jgi:hypothetical protein
MNRELDESDELSCPVGNGAIGENAVRGEVEHDLVHGIYEWQIALLRVRAIVDLQHVSLRLLVRCERAGHAEVGIVV